jgi:hypothetical protein
MDNLMELSEGNSVIENDILPKFREEHPDWDFTRIGEDVRFVIERMKANSLHPDEYLSYVFSHASELSASVMMQWSEEVRK